jgi:dihydroneopterin aldolase
MFTQTVALKDVKFKAFHGFYPEEQLIGSHFSVDVEVTFIPNEETENLNATVNYEDINSIITNAMQKTQKLLETVVRNIIDELISKYSYIQTATVGIKKMNPPMPGEIGCSFVQLSYEAV